MLYLAYGSNLNLGQMRQRCPRAEALYSATLDNYRLVFRGVADLIRDEGSVCEVGLFNITAQCEEALDLYEGFPHLYGKQIIEMGGEDVMTYTMNTGKLSPPSDVYYNSIFEGYEDFGLNPYYLDAARASSFIHCAR